jgi:hypothetical protein
MPSSGVLRSVAIVKTNVWEEFIKLRLLVTTNVALSSAIFLTLMKEAIRFSEAFVLTRVTRRHIREDDILHRHRGENFKY